MILNVAAIKPLPNTSEIMIMLNTATGDEAIFQGSHTVWRNLVTGERPSSFMEAKLGELELLYKNKLLPEAGDITISINGSYSDNAVVSRETFIGVIIASVIVGMLVGLLIFLATR